MAKLFVSYSRKDSAAARKLIEAFKSTEQEVWVDWEAIPPAADWLEQIFRGIEEADAFIFMISPDSIQSEVCKVEIARAVLNNKRIIPIVLRDVDPKGTIDDIRKLNWTFIRDTDNFEEGLAKIKTAIELDLDWLEEHRRLQVRALEWHRKKDPSLLLRGRDLRNARHMLQTYTTKDPIPTDLQQKYIEHSRRTERNRTVAWILTGITLIALTVLSVFAYRQAVLATNNAEVARKNADVANKNAEVAQKNERIARAAQEEAEIERLKAEEQEKIALEQKHIAEEQERLAEAQRSAARAQIYQTRTGELYTSTLLAIDSMKRSASPEAEEILRKNISLLPIPVAQIQQGTAIDILELNPDGSTFLSTSNDGSVCVRDLSDGSDLFCNTYPTPVADAIFVQDGRGMAVVDQTGVVRVVDSTHGDEQWSFDAKSPVHDLDIAPNGTRLAIGRENANITLIDIGDPPSAATNLSLSGGRLSVIRFSPDGNWFAAGSPRGNLAVWRTTSSQVLSNIPSHRGEVLSLQFDPNSRFLITGGADNYGLGYDVQNKQQFLRVLHSGWVTDIEFPQGTNAWFATASEDERVRLWEISSGRERLVMFQDGGVEDLTISASNEWIAATGADKTIRIWSTYSGAEMYQIPLTAPGTVLLFSPDDQILISGDKAGTLGIWNVSGMLAPVAYLELDRSATISKFSASGKELIVSDNNRVWEFTSGQWNKLGARPPVTPDLPIAEDIQGLAVSPAARMIGVSARGAGYYIQNLQTLIPTRVDPSGDASALVFSADGSLFITGSTDGTLETWDAKTGNQSASSNSLGSAILSLAASPSAVAAGLTDKVVLFDASAGEKRDELSSPGENRDLAFNADGSVLAALNSTGRVQVWKGKDGIYAEPLTIEKGPSYSIALSPSGNILAIGSVDSVYLIENATGQELRRIPHRGTVSSVSFSPDGALLATTSQKLVQVWDISGLNDEKPADLIATACSRLIQNFSQSQWTALFGKDQPYERLCDNLPVPE